MAVCTVLGGKGIKSTLDSCYSSKVMGVEQRARSSDGMVFEFHWANLIVQEFPFLDTDYPDEIEKENAFHWAGKDCQDLRNNNII